MGGTGNVALAISPLGSLLLLSVGAVGALVCFFYSWDQKRLNRWYDYCDARGWSYDPGEDAGAADYFSFLNRLRKGRNRFAIDIVKGYVNGRPFAAFSYHWETTSEHGDSNYSKHSWLTVVAVFLERDFPELTIAPEHFGKRFLNKFTGHDINFESHDFSKQFEVKSLDRRFAYDFCNPRMIEYLMNHPGKNLELEGPWLATIGEGKLGLEQIEPTLKHLTNVRSLMPTAWFPASNHDGR